MDSSPQHQETKNGRSWQPIIELTAVGIILILLSPGIVPLPIPTTVVLLVVSSASLWLRGQRWRTVGLRRPALWPRTLLIGIGVGTAIQLVSSGIVTPLLRGHRPPATGGFDLIRGDFLLFVISLVLMWLLAAFGEEMVYRGYLLNRLADLFGTTQRRWAASLLLTTAVFSLAHWPDGLFTMLEAAVTGLIFGGLTLWQDRNLWPAIIAHGVSNTIALTLIYLGVV